MSGVENSQTQSSQLKADANARFEERDFKAARDTYSKAIELDPTDATLYANRAQANLVLKDHEKALEDATKATELDPSSCKAWARKATAEQILARFRAAIISWKHALETLPPTNEMTDAQKLMRTECERGLAGTLQDATEAERRAKEDQAPPIDLPAPDASGQTDEANISSLPWDRAKVLLSDTTGKRIERAASSAWVILYAHQTFEKAMQGLGKLVQAETESGSTFNGEIGVLSQFVESVMRDPRAFYMEGPEFLEQYNHQVQFELSQTDGWFTDDVNVITREVQERAEAQGWNSVRLALSTTVNVWVMNGFLAQKVNQKPEDALDLLGRALGLIEWGRSALAQAGVQDPGPAFSEQYARSVKRFYFQAFMAAYMKKPGQDSEYSLDDLHGLLREYIKDITSKLPGVHKASASLDPSSVSSFWLYPMAEAYSNLGWIHFRRAVEGYVAEGDTGVEFNLASQFYIKAALGFDQDDEFYAYYLAEAVNALWNRQAPLLDVLPWCTKIIEAIPKMNAIWEWSQFRHARDPVLKQVLDFEETARTKLQSGELTVASRLLPEAPSNPEANPGEAPVVSRSRSY